MIEPVSPPNDVESQNPDSRSHSPMETAASNASPPPMQKRLGQLILKYPKLLVLVWLFAAVAFVSVLPVAYVSWWIGIPRISSWPAAEYILWIPAAFAILILACIPIWTLMLASYVLRYATDVSLSAEEESIREAQINVKETELDAIRRFENTDDAGLLPLLTYSRAQLDAYYKIGLSQTRRSFFHGIVAMWLGFGLLLSGIALYIIPLDKYGLNPPTDDFKLMLLSGAAIIEFISALFLWMYRSTTAQLTYLYDRQMYSHTAILSFRMASKIELTKGDETRAAIVTKLLDWNAKPDRPSPPSGGGLAALISKSTATKTSE